MKAIYGKKLYDTETATELARWRYSYFVGYRERVETWCTIVLYQARRGSYFRVIELDNPGESQPAAQIIPIKDEDLYREVAWYGGLEEILRLFPEDIEEA